MINEIEHNIYTNKSTEYIQYKPSKVSLMHTYERILSILLHPNDEMRTNWLAIYFVGIRNNNNNDHKTKTKRFWTKSFLFYM